MSDEKKLTPEEVLMNCIADTERIDKIIVLAYTKDQEYEAWSNNLAEHERLGMLEFSVVRCKKKIEEYENARK